MTGRIKPTTAFTSRRLTKKTFSIVPLTKAGLPSKSAVHELNRVRTKEQAEKRLATMQSNNPNSQFVIVEG